MPRKPSAACRVDRCRAKAATFGLCAAHWAKVPEPVRVALLDAFHCLQDRLAAVETTLRKNVVLLDRQAVDAMLSPGQPAKSNPNPKPQR